jgi:2'-5' RNA ligase
MTRTGIALIPTTTQMRQVIDLQQSIRQYDDLRPVLGLTEYHPHVTLLQGTADGPLGTAPLLRDIADLLTSSEEPPDMPVVGLEYAGAGWYFLQVERTALLRAAHDLAFRGCVGRLVVTAEDLAKDLIGCPERQARNYRRYGYRFLGEDFGPHFTLGRTGDHAPAPGETEWLPRLATMTAGWRFQAAQVTAYEIAENGGHLRMIDAGAVTL